jgi:hypothetical protein
MAFAVMVMQGNAQGIDQQRMDRDLKIAENILSTLSNNDRNIYSLSRSIESNYIPEYGVVFSLPQTALIYQTRVKGGVTVIAPTDSESSSYSYNYVVSDEEDDTEADVRVEVVTGDKAREETAKLIKEQMTIFLIDYADLIGQLNPSDRIMINVKNQKNQVWVSDRNLKTKQSKGMTAEILKSDLIAYKQGEASREKTIEKINFTERGDETRERDLELFSSIFSRLYEPDLSSTYYSSSQTINYERLENLGAIFSMKVYSSTNNKGFHTIRTTGESGLTSEERNSKVNAMYPEFESTLKENILDYGRTIKSLRPSENLIFKVKLTECKGCEMPKEIEVSIKASTLSDFDSGKIKREAALKIISIKKINN